MVASYSDMLSICYNNEQLVLSSLFLKKKKKTQPRKTPTLN